MDFEDFEDFEEERLRPEPPGAIPLRLRLNLGLFDDLVGV